MKILSTGQQEKKQHNLQYNFYVISFLSHLLTQMLVFLHSLLSNVNLFIFKLLFTSQNEILTPYCERPSGG